MTYQLCNNNLINANKTGGFMKNKINIPRGAVSIIGFPLDGCEAKFLSFDNISDIKTVLAYDYEDGKPWHDNTCVLEIIFHNYQENLCDDKIRILFDFPSKLLLQFSQIMLDLPITETDDNNWLCPSYPISIKMDLTCSYYSEPTNEELGIKTEDFDEFSCSIKHKKHFYKTNPEMPDD